MMVLIIFNLIVPTGWSVGLIRVEDVVVGAWSGIAVSVLLWPRGARRRCPRRSTTPVAVGAKFLTAAVLRVTRGASEDATDRVIALSHDGLEASRMVDDAVRQYLSESGGATDVRAPVVRAANRAIRLRAAAELIADVVPPPLGVYARTRAVLEAHAEAADLHVTGWGPGECCVDQRRLRPRAARRSAPTTISPFPPRCRWSPSRHTSARWSCCIRRPARRLSLKPGAA